MASKGWDWKPSPVSSLVVSQLEDELLIYDSSTSKAHSLNPSMRWVWELCDGRNCVQDIVNILGKLDAKIWKPDNVLLALKQLRAKSLLRDNLPPDLEWKHLSRRDVMRKLGTGALLSLPLIASVAIPTPAEAASCFSTGHLCRANSECCSGRCGISGISLLCLP